MTPLDDYAMTPQDLAKVSRAREMALTPCMQAAGFKNPLPRQDLPDERTFGLWGVDRAKQYGFHAQPLAPTTPGQEAPNTQANPAWESARYGCLDSNQEVLSSLTPPRAMLADRLKNDALASLQRRPEFAAIRSEWATCISRALLTPSARPTDFVSQEGIQLMEQQGTTQVISDAEIRIATTEATCNDSTQTTQRLADLWVDEQVPLVRSNEAALNADKTKVADLRRRIDQFLATHG